MDLKTVVRNFDNEIATAGMRLVLFLWQLIENWITVKLKFVLRHREEFQTYKHQLKDNVYMITVCPVS